MKASETCPKCGSRKLLVVAVVGTEQPPGAGIMTLPVAVTEVPDPSRPLLFGRLVKVVQAGHFEAWVCARCGLTELYAQQLGDLARLAESSSAVRVVDRELEPSSGPYRRGR